jgi:hypothetical protein
LRRDVAPYAEAARSLAKPLTDVCRLSDADVLRSVRVGGGAVARDDALESLTP